MWLERRLWSAGESSCGLSLSTAPGALGCGKSDSHVLVLQGSCVQYAPLNVLQNTRPLMKFVREGILDVCVCVGEGDKQHIRLD